MNDLEWLEQASKLPPYNVIRNGLIAIHDPWRDLYGRNILPVNSDNFQTGWGASGGEGITVTDYPTTIDGQAVIAKRIQGNGAGTNTTKYYCSIQLSGGSLYGSMWIKVLSGNCTVAVANAGTATTYSATTTISKGTFKTLNGTATATFRLSTNAITDALDVVVYQPQINLGQLYPYALPSGLPQSTLDYSGHGNSLVNGSTASADTNDAAFSGVAMVHTTNQYQLSSTISTLNMSNFSLLIAGKFAGTSGAITSLAVPSVTNKYQGVKYVSIGNLAIISCNGGTESVSSNLAVSTTDNVTLLFTANGGILTLKNLATGASVTLTDTAPTGSPRIGMGCVAGSTVAQIASALTWYNVAPYTRLLSTAEVASNYVGLKRYNNKKGVVVV